MAELTLRLLGRFEIASPHGPVRVQRRQPLALLAYLAVTGAASRDQLALLLFSECDDGVARSRLRRVLHELRHSLQASGVDPDILRVHGDHVALVRARCSIDIVDFRSAAPIQAQAEAALKLYRGVLLDGFRVVGAAEFELWLLDERERVEQARLDMLGCMLDTAAGQARWNTVLFYGAELVDADPLNEATHQQLMRAYAAQGKRSAVVRQYNALCDALRHELGVEPTPETQALFRELVQNQARSEAANQAPPARVHGIPFVGREPELDTIAAAVRAQVPQVRLVCIHGLPGAGKTRLLDEALTRAGSAHPATALVRVWCHDTSASVPYQALADSLRPLLAIAENPFARRLPPQDEPGAEQRLWERIARALRTVAHKQSATLLLLAIDDLHHADSAMLRALPYLLRRLQADTELPQCVVLLTCNEADQPATVAALLHWIRSALPDTAWLRLAPFTEAEVMTLVEAYGSPGTDATVLGRRLHRETEGDPFFLVETLHELHQRGAPSAAAELPLPHSVRTAVEERRRRLPAKAQQIGDAAAVLGHDIDLGLLRQVAGASADTMVQAVEQLEHAGFVKGFNGGYRWSHAALCNTLYERLSTARRYLLHRRVASILARAVRPQNAAALLHHARLAREWELAVRAARKAADHARRMAARADALQFERVALEVIDAHGVAEAERFAVLLDLEDDAHILGRREEQTAALAVLESVSHTNHERAQASYRRGRLLAAQAQWSDAQPYLQQALAASDNHELSGAVHLVLAHCLSQQGQRDAASQLVQGVLAAAEAHNTTPLRLQALLALARLAQLTDHDQQALAWIEQAQPLAQPFPAVQAELWLLRARTHLRRGEHERMLRDTAQGYRAAVAAGDVQLQADCLRQQGIAAGRLYRFGEGEALYEQARALYRTLENPQGQAAVTLNLAILRYRVGDFAAAFGAAQDAHALAVQIGDRRGQATTAVNLAAIAVMLGQGDAAAAWSHTALVLADELGLPIHRVLAITNRGGALLCQNQLEAARDCFARALALRPAGDIGSASDQAWLAFVSAELGDLEIAREQSAAAVAALATHAGVDIPQQIHAVHAFVLHRSQDEPAAVAALATAEQTLAAVLANIHSPADRRRYLRSLAPNRFIRAARRGDWTSEHPLF
jgi:DNA-binding SARP family transcriptional activator/predicted ATPase